MNLITVAAYSFDNMTIVADSAPSVNGHIYSDVEFLKIVAAVQRGEVMVFDSFDAGDEGQLAHLVGVVSEASYEDGKLAVRARWIGDYRADGKYLALGCQGRLDGNRAIDTHAYRFAVVAGERPFKSAETL